jgi:hypothetical protein
VPPKKMSKAENKAYREAKKRLEKSQAKYIDKPNKSKKKKMSSATENKIWEQKRKQRYNDRVWKGWRESDGGKAPVITYKTEDLEK